jgi:hypothetical protein
MPQSLSIERSRPARRTEKFGALPAAAVFVVGALAFVLAVMFALVLAGVLPPAGEVVPLFTT